MSAAHAEGELVRSAFTGTRLGPEPLTALLDQRDHDFPLLLAALGVAARARFADLSDLREVTRWVGALNATLDVEGGERRLPPRETEAVVRAVLSEPYLMAAVEPGVGVRAGQILRALVQEVTQSPAEAQALLDRARRDARTLAAREPDLTAAWAEICGESAEFWLPPGAESAVVAAAR
jgi:hypothetical protein